MSERSVQFSGRSEPWTAESQFVEVYLVTRYYCASCHGSGGNSNPITGESVICSACKGTAYQESAELLTEAEAEACRGCIDWNASALVGRR